MAQIDSGDSNTTRSTRWIIRGALVAYGLTVALLFGLSAVDWTVEANAGAPGRPTAQHLGTALAVTADGSDGLVLRLNGASESALAGAKPEHAVLRRPGDFDRLARLSIGEGFLLQLDGQDPVAVTLIDWPLRFSGALFLTIVAADRDDVRPFLMQVNRRADIHTAPIAGLVGDFHPPRQ